MPIEFRCPGCSKLLRTPDESAGKKAKCPQCASVVDVPLPGTQDASGASPVSPVPPVPPVPPPFHAEPSQGAAGKPFGGTPDASWNPYAPPQPVDSPFEGAVGGALPHRKVNMDDVLRTTWQIFTSQLGPFAAVGGVLFAVYVGLQVIGQVGGIVAQTTKEPAIVAAFAVINGLGNTIVQMYLQLAAVHYMLRALRLRDMRLGNLFSIAGSTLVRGFLLTIVLGAAFLLLMVLCGLPAGIGYLATRQQEVAIGLGVVGGLVGLPLLVWFGVSVSLAIPFLVDRQVGVLDAISLSRQYMQGNKLTVFLLFLVTSVLGGIFSCLTCYLGMILYLPFWNLLIGVTYLNATGQAFDKSGKPGVQPTASL